MQSFKTSKDCMYSFEHVTFVMLLCMICTRSTQLHLVWPALRKREYGRARDRTENCDFACYSLFYFYFWPFGPVIDRFLTRHNVASYHISCKVRSYHRHHHVHPCVCPLTQRTFSFNDSPLQDHSGRTLGEPPERSENCKHGLSRISGILWLIFTGVKTECLASVTRLIETND